MSSRRSCTRLPPISASIIDRPVTFPNPHGQRDPLSVQFDRQARLVVGLAIQQYEKRLKNKSLRQYIRVTVPNPAGEGIVRDDTPDRLTRHERAFLRSLYYDSRIWQWTSRKKPDSRKWATTIIMPRSSASVSRLTAR